MKAHSPLAGPAMALLLCGAALVPLAAPRLAAAQNNPTYTNVVPPAAAVTLHTRIEAINMQTREVTLAGKSGHSVTLVAGPLVRLELLKVGDTVNANFYRSVAFVVSPPGMPAPEDEVKVAMARQAKVPGGAIVGVTRVSGLVVAVDLEAHSIDLVPQSGGGVITVEVTDPARQAAMSALKAGDTLTVVVSRSLAVSIDPAP